MRWIVLAIRHSAVKFYLALFVHLVKLEVVLRHLFITIFLVFMVLAFDQLSQILQLKHLVSWVDRLLQVNLQLLLVLRCLQFVEAELLFREMFSLFGVEWLAEKGWR